ncbi:MBG domain-containing protein [Parapedobacter indicus]|uniref:C-terminal domain of CHU protein family protein n=1 Tax=Parapedobacter indicus TaxID=1477437 RepID=A0A1I3VKW1_9SPHI|nr:MBG domain-containing protein [Parapedobacter indicus]SFJ96018.1 C-terminal domain of CHU protein family protein [Parapedobacter indicus]
MRKLLPILCLFLLLTNLRTQAQVQPGDLAFTSFNFNSDFVYTMSNNPNGTWSFVVLKDLSAGTVLFFTNTGWNADEAAFLPRVADTDPVISLTLSSTLTAGTVVTWKETINSNVIATGAFDALGLDGTTAFPRSTAYNDKGMILRKESSSIRADRGDQILCYTTPDNTWDNATRTFIAAINVNRTDPEDDLGNRAAVDAVTGWHATPENDFDFSSVPAGLTNGVNCLSVELPGAAETYSGYRYIGTTTGDAATLRAAINDRANWMNSGTTALPANLAPVAASFTVSAGSGTEAEFWFDDFEDSVNPSSGTRAPSNQGGTGTPHTAYFKRTNNSEIDLATISDGDYSGFEGSWFWAGEDHDAVFGAGNAEQQIEWTGIDISGKTDISFKGSFAAQSTNPAWESTAFDYSHDDYVLVEYSIDGAPYQTLIDFRANTGQEPEAGILNTYKQLAEDTNGDKIGEGTVLTKAFNEFSKSIPGTGSTLSLRIRAYSNNTFNEEWAIDNFRLLTADAGPPPPIITSANYDASTGTLVVTGTDFVALSGSDNDIDVDKLTVTGEGGATYTLTSNDVEITDATSFTVVLNSTDHEAVNQRFNKNGTTSTGGTAYNLAAAEDWAAGVDPSTNVADLTGNGVTVSNVAVPTITSANYDAGTGTLLVTGTGFLSLAGANNDIVANKFTFTGEGGTTYTLTDTQNEEISSWTSFMLILSATDKAGLLALLNKDGTSAEDGTTYNLAAAEDWAAGAHAAMVTADLTGNGITVANVPVAPTVTTSAASAVVATSATLGGDVTADGGAAVTARGIVWNLTGDPTTADPNVPAAAGGTGVFNRTVGLPAGRTIFVRAYATNTQGTAYGNEIELITPAATPPGNALAFNGSQYITIDASGSAATDFGGNSSFTIEAWIKPDNFTGNPTIFGHKNGGTPTAGYALFLLGDGRLYLEGTGSGKGSEAAVETGKWNHVAVAFEYSGTGNVGQAAFYINGEEAGGGGEMSVASTGVSGRIGAFSSGQQPFRGDIDEVKIWNAVRTQEQIAAGVTSVTPASSSGLVLCYNVDQGVPEGTNTALNTLYDQTSNGFQGVLSGFALTGTTTNWKDSYAMVVPVAAAASDTDADEFTANWSAPVHGEVDSYLLDVATDALFTDFVTGYQGKDVGTALSAEVTGRDLEITYYYRVRATHGGVIGGASQTIEVPPASKPVVSVSTTPVDYLPGGPAVAVAPDAVLADDDSDVLSEVTVTFTARPGGTSDYMGLFVPQANYANDHGISYNFNTAGGVLTLSGTASIADYQYVLRGAAYLYTGTAGTAPRNDRTLDIVAQDEDGMESEPVTVTIAFPAMGPDDNNVLYVDKNVSGGNGSGDSWANAIPELADALKWAEENKAGWTPAQPLQLWVATGIYKPLHEVEASGDPRDRGFKLVQNVQLYGGFDPANGIASLDDDRILPDPASTSNQGTVLSGDLDNNDVADGLPVGDNAYHVVLALGVSGGPHLDENTVLDGFTIAGGKADDDSELDFVNEGYAIDRNQGGGMVFGYAYPAVRNVALKHNQAEYGGGAAVQWADGPPVTFNSVSVIGNQAAIYGGGMYASAGSIYLTGSLLAGNHAGVGVGGSGIHMSTTGNLQLTNVTLTDNTGGAGGISLLDDEQAILRNSLVWNNSISGAIDDASAYNIIGNGSTMFVDAASNDYRPAAGSTAVNAGDPAIDLAIFPGGPDAAMDLSGAVRLQGGTIDIGALESAFEDLDDVGNDSPIAMTTAYGSALDEVAIPADFTVEVTLTDGSVEEVEVDPDTDNWVLTSSGTYDGEVAGTYSFEVPLILPATTETPWFTNTQELKAAVALTVNKGTPSWSVAVGGETAAEGSTLNRTYGDAEQLTFELGDWDGDALDITFDVTEGEELVDIGGFPMLQGIGVGTVEVEVTLPETDNFEESVATFTVEIAPKAITFVPVADQTKGYGATDPADYGYELALGSELVDGDVFADIVSGTSRETGEDVGTYDIAVAFEGTKADYYDITFVTDNNAFAITPATLTVAADGGQGKVYGSAEPALTYSATGFELTDDESILTGALERASGENVDSYTINQGTLDAGGNYTIAFAGADFAITPATLTVTADAGQGKVYGSAEAALTYSATGFELTDDESILTGALERASGEDVDSYAITQGTLDAGGNYTMAFAGADFAITPATLTISADAGQDKVYGSAEPALTYSATGFELMDDESILTGALIRAPGEDVDSYAITQGTLDAGGNYTMAFAGADFAITPATLTIAADAGQGKVYGSAEPALTYSATGFELTDDESILTGALIRAPGEGMDNYAINQGTLDAGGNYTIAFTGEDFVITQLSVTVTADNETKVFGTADPELSYSVAPALVAGDRFTGALSREPGEAVGSYGITQGSLALSDNYALAFNGAELEITASGVLDITFADGSFVYDGTAKFLEIGRELPEGTSVSYQNNSRTDAGSQEVTATVSGGNYQTLVLTAVLTVTPAERTLAFPALEAKTYGDNGFNGGASASSGEEITYTSSNPAVAEITAAGQIRITGAGEATITATVPENGNYVNRPETRRTLVVGKATQTISFNAPAEVNRDAGTVQLDVTASSGLPVSLTIDDEQVATLSGTALNVLRLGTVTITATQAGDVNHEAAEPVTVRVRVVDPASDFAVRVHPAVSPNGDGINEFLIIEGIRDFPKNRVRVINRNGTVVWEASGYDNDRVAFRGIGTGQQLLPAGTYFYIVEIGTGSGTEYRKGYFVLRY